MIPAQRQHFILTCLAEREVVSIADLVDRMGVSHMTVRRDIHALEQAGRVASVTGGVRLADRLSRELPHLQKVGLNPAEKRAIGQQAAQMVQDGMAVYLDAGTTTLEIARQIATRRDLTVVTNDFMICAHLSAASDCTLYHTGGLVERANQSCVGQAAGDALARFNLDLAFVSTSSWTQAGLSSPSDLKGPVKAAAAAQARRTVLATDATKLGVVAAMNILPMTAIDTIVTDARIDPDTVRDLRARGITVILAQTDAKDSA